MERQNEGRRELDNIKRNCILELRKFFKQKMSYEDRVIFVEVKKNHRTSLSLFVKG